MLERLEYVGVLALELFQVGDRLLANEMAPRVHNSGHWTIEGAETSQFENHLRAVCGLPLGSTALRMPCTMVNLIGAAPATAELAAVTRAHVHLYGKAPRPGRKIGHVTVTGDGDWRAAAALADAVRRCACRGGPGVAGCLRGWPLNAAVPEPDLRRPTPARCRRRR